MADMIKLGGLWLQESSKGTKYFSGKLTPTARLLIFRNDHKESDNQPDYIMYLAPVERSNEDDYAQDVGSIPF